MDRAELAKECVAVEKAGGSVREFLAEHGCISPWGTWYRLQKEELHRSESQITSGKGDANKLSRKITLEQKKKAVQIAIDGGDVLEYLRQLGSKNPSGLWWTIKNDVKAADPELYAKIPRLDAKQQHIIPQEERAEVREERLKEAEKKGLVQEEKHLKLGDTVTVEIKGEPVAESRVIAHEINTDAYGVKVDEHYVFENVGRIPEELPKAPEPAPVEEVKKRLAASPVMVVPAGFMVTSIRGTFGEWHLDQKHDSLDFRGAEGEEICFRPQAWEAFMDEIRSVMQILGVKN